MARIFISYRREDSAGVTKRIYECLRLEFLKAELFLDVDNIPIGENFQTYIGRAIEGSDVFMPVIGPRWLSATSRGERRRIFEDDDFVRMEVESALIQNVPILPVVILPAAMPRPEDLPEPIAGLALRNAAFLDAEHKFDADMKRLCEVIRYIFVNRPPRPFMSPQEEAAADLRRMIDGWINRVNRVAAWFRRSPKAAHHELERLAAIDQNTDLATKSVSILLVRGEDPQGQSRYAYVAVRADRLPALMQAQRQGQVFFPEDYGVIVEGGQGEPALEVRKKMEVEYGFNHEIMLDIPDERAALRIVNNLKQN
jgi:hypothetical protein